MTIHNLPLLHAALAENGPTVKFLMSDSAIAFFPSSLQHRDVKPEGLSYEDDYRGNAVAGLFVVGKPEIRYHSAYSGDRILTIWKRFQSSRECTCLSIPNPSYQGRHLF